VDEATNQPTKYWLILLPFGQDVFSMAIFLLIENALKTIQMIPALH
jgi:hypothetical protein